jgi:hypothetical protein
VFFTLNTANWLKLQCIYSDTFPFTLPLRLLLLLLNNVTVPYEVQITIEGQDTVNYVIALPKCGSSKKWQYKHHTKIKYFWQVINVFSEF